VEGITPDRQRSVVGMLRATGLRPSFLDKFERRGVAVPAMLRQAEAGPARLAARRAT
jgi:hypothetical protein